MPEADQVGDLYFAVFNEIAIIAQLSSRLLERHLPEGFVTNHFGVVNHLVRLGDGRTPLDIARAFQVPKTTMTHVLAGLEKAGLIRFAANPRDGRSKCVFLTDGGRAFHGRAIASIGPDIAAMAQAIPPAHMAALRPALSALRIWLDAERDS